MTSVMVPVLMGQIAYALSQGKPTKNLDPEKIATRLQPTPGGVMNRKPPFSP
ncbi:hypothetical protein DFR72_117188 [Lentzea flaviverrucosa]|uniref:Uncharacterized protein n=1 Tax=Lentzea flaviverrucosa TaxID=200379 RepID=A0A1H9XS40_9PSEU|nr:hypothetical protein DFR72_117188 [Lentzea flaviverrucosa]SES48976.1 hypothetical protein SAMN05216195_11729 [Lentzea flaviverrucosa]